MSALEPQYDTDMSFLRPSGIPGVGDVTWGAHFCHFYRGREDLTDSLVPYFKAGLDAGEYCLWVTSEPFVAEDARAALRAQVPDLERRTAAGQIEIIDHRDWYLKTGKASPDEVLSGWIEREQQALRLGFAGLRLTGNTAWLERCDWQSFVEYESRVTETFADRHIVGLCSYCMTRCQPEDVLDVVRNHQFAVARREGCWELLESASLKHSKAELLRLNEGLEQRVQERTYELEQALRARDEFLSVASHELKTPITSLQLYVQSLSRAAQRGQLAEQQLQQRLTKSEDQCRRLQKLVDNLLDVTRAQSKELAVSREQTDLAQLATNAVERFSEELARAQCDVALDAAEPVVGQWDPVRVDQLISNLLSNVTRYAPGAPVEVRVWQDGATGYLAVTDHGPGIPERDRTRVFERFAQGSVRHYPGGFGLGLWIVDQVVRAHGGAVTLESAEPSGASFVVALPVGH